MEWVDHVHIVQVGSGRFVGNVDRMFQWQIPHRERLKLGVASAYAALVFIVELAEADRHFAAARSRSSDNDQFAARLNIVVFAESFVAGDQFHIVWVAIDKIMNVGFDAHALKAMSELVGRPLTIVVGDDNRTHHEVASHELISQTQHILVVGDAEVGPHLVLFDVFCADNNDDFELRPQLGEHFQFAVGFETWEDTRGMVVVEEFPSKF